MALQEGGICIMVALTAKAAADILAKGIAAAVSILMVCVKLRSKK